MSEDLFTRLARRALAAGGSIRPAFGLPPGPVGLDAPDIDIQAAPLGGGPHEVAEPTLTVDVRSPATGPAEPTMVRTREVAKPVSASTAVAPSAPVVTRTESTRTEVAVRDGATEPTGEQVVHRIEHTQNDRQLHTIERLHETSVRPAAVPSPVVQPSAQASNLATSPPTAPTIEIHIGRLDIGSPTARTRPGGLAHRSENGSKERPPTALALADYLAGRDRE